MYGSPNPDTLYRNAAIDGGGEYRISGYRGTVPDVSIMPFGPPVAGGLQTFAPFRFDDLEIERRRHVRGGADCRATGAARGTGGGSSPRCAR